MSQTVSQDISLPRQSPHSTPGRQAIADKMAALSFPQPQRSASAIEIPQTPRTQLIKNQLEQENFEMMNTLQQKKTATNKGSLCSIANGTSSFPPTVHGEDVQSFGPSTNSCCSTTSIYIYSTTTSHCVYHTGVWSIAYQIRGTYGRSSIITSPS